MLISFAGRMVSDTEQDPEPEWLRNLPLRSEEIGFTREELVECDACGKPNAPKRVACLYCGAPMDEFAAEKVDIEIPESWEKGYNVILVDIRGGDVDRAAARIGSLLGFEKEAADAMLGAGRKIPLARVRTEAQAKRVSEELSDLAIKTTIVSDEELAAASPPTRLRSIAFEDGTVILELFNRGRFEVLKPADLAFVIPGVLLEWRSESVEKRKRRSTKTVREAEMSSDEPLIDLYSFSDMAGWRIRASGFDFSCLGAEKSLVVGDNMKRLVLKLVEFAPDVTVVDDYMKLRSVLENSWPSETRRDSLALGLSRKAVSNVVTTTNALQLTRYSRLQWQLNEKKI